MLPIDQPTRDDILELAAVEDPACVSIYIETTPVSTEIEASRIAFANGVREAVRQLEDAGVDKRRVGALVEQLDDLAEDDAFWAHQARSLGVLATPEHLSSFRLANRLTPTTQTGDRLHLKPLLRATTHPQAAFVLALSQKVARLVEIAADIAPQEVAVPGMPKDAASAAGRGSVNYRSRAGGVTGDEGRKGDLRKYVRAVDAALRPFLTGRTEPLILVTNAPLDDLFRASCSYPGLLAEGFGGEADRMTPTELAQQARPILDAVHAAEIETMRALHSRRTGQGRATTDIAKAARAAVAGAIETLMVDMDRSVPGRVDPETGAVSFAESERAETTGVVDRIAMLALGTGARVVSVRAGELPEGAGLAATLRYPA